MAQHDKFIEQINQMYGLPVAQQDAADAFRNFSGFVSVLFRINERVGLVVMKEKETSHAD